MVYYNQQPLNTVNNTVNQPLINSLSQTTQGTIPKAKRIEGIQTALFGQPMVGTEVVEIKDWQPTIPHICKGISEVVFLPEEIVNYVTASNRKAKIEEIQMGTVITNPMGNVLVENQETVALCRRCGKLFLQVV